LNDKTDKSLVTPCLKSEKVHCTTEELNLKEPVKSFTPVHLQVYRTKTSRYV
jgi:hypothetical protein